MNKGRLKAPAGYTGPRERSYRSLLADGKCLNVVGKIERLRDLDRERYHEDVGGFLRETKK
jgi:hypothetical protein